MLFDCMFITYNLKHTTMATTLCSRIEYCFLHEAAFVYPKIIKMREGFTLRPLQAAKIDYNHDIKDAVAGPLATHTVRIQSAGSLSPLSELSGAKVILRLHTNDGYRVIGTKKYPCIYSISEKLPEKTITFTTSIPK